MVAQQASVCLCHGAVMVKGTVKMEQMRSSVLQVSPGRERERRRKLLKIAPVWIMHRLQCGMCVNLMEWSVGSDV